MRVVGDRVPLGNDHARQIRVPLDLLTDHKERGPCLVALKEFQERRCARRVRSVIDGEPHIAAGRLEGGGRGTKGLVRGQHELHEDPRVRGKENENRKARVVHQGQGAGADLEAEKDGYPGPHGVLVPWPGAKR